MEPSTDGQALKRRLSNTEQFRLNSLYREELNGELGFNVLQRRYNNLMAHVDSDASETIYVVNSTSLIRNNYYLKLFQSYLKNLLIVGPPQSGKTSLVKDKIHQHIKFKDFKSSNIPRYISYTMYP
mmetsp:Transcript_9211/g.8616  ORF Transcript_9211/g.8616 Transcript_9211/m.8616 type:complete len:126 (+) Transcript_9211:1001-1378(+)